MFITGPVNMFPCNFITSVSLYERSNADSLLNFINSFKPYKIQFAPKLDHNLLIQFVIFEVFDVCFFLDGRRNDKP